MRGRVRRENPFVARAIAAAPPSAGLSPSRGFEMEALARRGDEDGRAPVREGQS